METEDVGRDGLARSIVAMQDAEIIQFIRNQSRERRFSRTVQTLNEAALSPDTDRRDEAMAAIRRLGFI